MRNQSLAWLCLSLSVVGCAMRSEATDSTDQGIIEDPNHAPQVVRVAVRFTQNDVSDVGYSFSSSWIPFTSVSRDAMDGFSWGVGYPGTAEDLVPLYAPDQPGAGYATAVFDIEIPYDTTGAIAYGLARVKLEREFINTQMATTLTRKYSPLRIRSGGDQPCLSITMGGQLSGKLKAVPIPYTDQGFTERNWDLGTTDGSGVPVKNVVLGTLDFASYCWPEDVEGTTQASGGVAAPPGAFVMVGKSDGQGGSDTATIYINLLENTSGAVTVGDVFSTDATLLDDHSKAAFDTAVNAFAPGFASGVDQGVQANLNAQMAGD